MRDGIHPEYREVVFQDVSANFSFLSRSTIRTKDTVTWEDGNTYPLVRLDISSASHPFFTGKMKFMDATGQIERFKKKFGANYGQKKETPKPAEEPAKAEGEAVK